MRLNKYVRRSGWKATFWRWAVVVTWVCAITAVIGLVIAIADFNGTDFRNQSVGRFGSGLICAIFIPAFFWPPVGLGALLWGFHKNLQTAAAPIPSLQQIEWQLRQEGYEPSLQDLLAVEAHLRSRRNEAALVAGAIFLGLHEGERISRGRWP